MRSVPPSGYWRARTSPRAISEPSASPIRCMGSCSSTETAASSGLRSSGAIAGLSRYLDETYFAWLGTTGPESVFYYRIQSPVILIEFDHQGPIALDGPRVPSRRHVHSMVRTPNGNDYGKDLLRQHYEQRRTDAAHGHVH